MNTDELEVPQPVTPPPVEPGAPSGASRKRWLVFGCGGCALATLLTVVVGGGLLLRFGMGVFADQVRADLRDNRVVIKHLGRIESLEVDIMASLSASEQEEFVFKAEGTRDSGVITAICVTVDGETEQVESGTLQLSDGEIVDLFPSRGGLEW